MKTGINLFIISGLVLLLSCRSTEKKEDAELAEASSGDQAVIAHAGQRVISLATEQLGALGDSGWEVAHKGACFAAGGYAMRDIDGLRVSLGADPVGYFPGVSRFAGTPLQVEYVFFRQEDNSIVGQGYIAPSLRLSPGANPRAPVDVNLGYTFNCDGNPDSYAGAFVGGAFAGFGVDFAYDQTVLFRRAMMSSNPDTQPIDFQRALHEKYFSGVNKIRENHFELQRANEQTSAVSKTSLRQAAHTAGGMDFTIQDGFSPLSMGQVIEALSSSEYEAVEAFQKTGVMEKLTNLRQLMTHVPENFDNPVVEGIFKAQANENFGEVFSLLEEEKNRLMQVVHPVFFFSRARTADQSQLVDLRVDYLSQIQKQHGRPIRLWIESGLDGYKERYEGLQQLRLLVLEWYLQLNGGRPVDTDMSVGGHHPGSVFTGCNSISYNPRALANYMRGMTLPIRTVGTVLNPFKLAINLVRMPMSAAGSIINLKSTIKNAGSGLQGTYVNTRYVYKLPGTSYRWEPNAVGAGMGYLQSFFTKACPHELFGD